MKNLIITNIITSGQRDLIAAQLKNEGVNTDGLRYIDQYFTHGSGGAAVRIDASMSHAFYAYTGYYASGYSDYERITAKQYLKQDGGWIALKDRVPSLRKDGDYVFAGHDSDGYVSILPTTRVVELGNSHWMPIPRPKAPVKVKPILRAGEYYAEIKEEGKKVKVGCQEISFEQVEAIYQTMKEEQK